MSAAKAGAAVTASAAAPSKIFFIVVPRYSFGAIKPNNVTSIRLLCGNAGPSGPNCDGIATKRPSSLADKAFCPVNEVVARLVDVGHDQGKVQTSPKSDQVSFILFACFFGPNPGRRELRRRSRKRIPSALAR